MVSYRLRLPFFTDAIRFLLAAENKEETNRTARRNRDDQFRTRHPAGLYETEAMIE